MNPFRETRKQGEERNALQEAIQRALKRDETCGTKNNPHVMQILKEETKHLASFTASDDAIRISTGTLWRCIKCNESYPALPVTQISRVTIELVTRQPFPRRNSDGRECDE